MIKIAFVLAYNDERSFNKCISCINDLSVPQDVEIETLGVQGENSICDVYNACQAETAADYYVFIRENVYIINNKFVSDVIAYFKASPECFAAGVIGGKREGEFIEWENGAINVINDDRANRFVLDGGGCSADYLAGQLVVVKGKYNWPQEENRYFDVAFSEAAAADGKKLMVFAQSEPWCVWEYGHAYGERADFFDEEKGAWAFVSRDFPLVSVVVPAYNAAEFIGETIESICKQTYPNIEVIVVDDCSTDNTREVISSYAKDDARISAIFLDKNRHVCYSTNAGYHASKGKYFCDIGHDDTCRAWKIEEQVAYMEHEPECPVCFTLCHIVDDYGENLNKRLGFVNIFDQANRSAEEWVARLYFKGNCICAPSSLMRKASVGKVLYKYDYLQLQDYELWLRLLLQGNIFVIQNRTTLYRHFIDNPINLSNAGNVSEGSPKLVRIFSEGERLRWKYIMEIPDVQFVHFFKPFFTNPGSQSSFELMCEKALILSKFANTYCGCVFADIMNQDDGIHILEEKYNFTTLDFYEIETKFVC